MILPLVPKIYDQFTCPECQSKRVDSNDFLFQGIHVLAQFHCAECGGSFFGDLPLSQALMTPYIVNKELTKIYGHPRALEWFGRPLLRSLQHPSQAVVDVTIEKFRTAEHALLLNSIDYLYGHCLLKLLNVEHFLNRQEGEGLIVLVPQFLRWLVPRGVAEIWSVNIPLSLANQYFPSLDTNIKKELQRFASVKIAQTHPHPRVRHIQAYTNVPTHDFSRSSYRITFVWRDDRVWGRNETLSRIIHAIPWANAFLLLRQNLVVRRLFSILRKHFPEAQFTVAGLGRRTKFPEWILDERVGQFSDSAEVQQCRVFSESRLVIGAHGSHMLLPSAHAGITVDLMPPSRWGNLAQDIIFQEQDVRMGAFRFRFLPMSLSMKDLAIVARSCIDDYFSYKNLMQAVPRADEPSVSRRENE